jgi:citronellyl-CoA dehydrogenase
MIFSEDHEKFRSELADFIETEINPFIDEWEKSKTPLHELFPKLGKKGYLGVRYAKEYGGLGLDYWYDTVFLEELGHIRAMGPAGAIADHTHMATPAIAEFGSDYLKKAFLEPAIRGEMVSAIAVTEPGAGSDVANLSTWAQRRGDQYVINGSKTFITNGVQADFTTLLARTTDDPGYHSFSLLVVPKSTPGFSISRNLDKIGWKSSDMAELFFNDAVVPDENRIGKEGEGFIYQMQQFQHERFAALPMTCTMIEDIIEHTLGVLNRGETPFASMHRRRSCYERIAGWLTENECLRRMTYHIVRMKMAGLDATREISMGKLMSGELASKVANGCLEITGMEGCRTNKRTSRFFLDSRAASIAGGANEVMREIIFRMAGF